MWGVKDVKVSRFVLFVTSSLCVLLEGTTQNNIWGSYTPYFRGHCPISIRVSLAICNLIFIWTGYFQYRPDTLCPEYSVTQGKKKKTQKLFAARSHIP